MVKKLIRQRRHLGDIRPQHHRSGRKPKILATHRQTIRKNLAAKPDSLAWKNFVMRLGLSARFRLCITSLWTWG